jgi:hypothetical protein
MDGVVDETPRSSIVEARSFEDGFRKEKSEPKQTIMKMLSNSVASDVFDVAQPLNDRVGLL